MSRSTSRSVASKPNTFAVVTLPVPREWLFEGAIPGLTLEAATTQANAFNRLSGDNPELVAFVVISNPAIASHLGTEGGAA